MSAETPFDLTVLAGRAGGTGETIIECEDVEKWFGRFQALNGIDLAVGRQEVVVVNCLGLTPHAMTAVQRDCHPQKHQADAKQISCGNVGREDSKQRRSRQIGGNRSLSEWNCLAGKFGPGRLGDGLRFGFPR